MNPIEGDVLTIEVGISNIGNASIDEFELYIQSNRSEYGHGLSFSRWIQIVEMSAGGTTTFQAVWNTTGFTGPIGIWVTANPDEYASFNSKGLPQNKMTNLI